jgi:hypothetical protein
VTAGGAEPEWIPRTGARRRLRAPSVAVLLSGTALLMIPWTAWLAVSLPSKHVAHHWDLGWVGFDVALTATIGATGVALWRRSRFAPFLATAAGTLLVADTWFDIVTSGARDELELAIVLAALAQLPLALLCFWLVRGWVRRSTDATLLRSRRDRSQDRSFP